MTQRFEPKQIDIVSLECNVGLQPPIEQQPIKFNKICQAYLKTGLQQYTTYDYEISNEFFSNCLTVGIEKEIDQCKINYAMKVGYNFIELKS